MIYQYDLNRNLVNKFKTVKEASDTLNINSNGIYKTLKGFTQSYKGYIWHRDNKGSTSINEILFDFNQQLIRGEIEVFRSENHYKKNNHYEIVCFNKEQAVTLVNEINKRFKKWQWIATWTYDLIDKVYKVKLKKSI